MTTHHKVLLADDDRLFAETVVDELERRAEPYGIQFCVAHDGEECLRVAEKVRPDLILLDVNLPVVDGFEVLAELQRRNILTRVMMLSGFATDIDSAIRCVRAGACDYIVKTVPLDAEMLIKRIRRHLLLDNTTNLSLANLSPVQQDFVNEAARLKDEVTDLRLQNAKLLDRARERRARMLFDTLHKAALVSIAVGGILVLWMLGFKTPAQIGGVFVLLLLILIIPADKLQSLSAQVPKLFSARVTLAGAAHTDSEPEAPRNG